MPVRNLDVVTVHQDIISFSLVLNLKCHFILLTSSFLNYCMRQSFTRLPSTVSKTIGWVPVTMRQTPDEV